MGIDQNFSKRAIPLPQISYSVSLGKRLSGSGVRAIATPDRVFSGASPLGDHLSTAALRINARFEPTPELS